MKEECNTRVFVKTLIVLTTISAASSKIDVSILADLYSLQFPPVPPHIDRVKLFFSPSKASTLTTKNPTTETNKVHRSTTRTAIKTFERKESVKKTGKNFGENTMLPALSQKIVVNTNRNKKKVKKIKNKNNDILSASRRSECERIAKEFIRKIESESKQQYKVGPPQNTHNSATTKSAKYYYGPVVVRPLSIYTEESGESRKDREKEIRWTKYNNPYGYEAPRGYRFKRSYFDKDQNGHGNNEDLQRVKNKMGDPKWIPVIGPRRF